MHRFDKVCVLGLGYIGLPTATIIANRGVKVLGVDVNHRVVETINQGEIHIVEPDLAALVRDVVRSGQLRAATQPEHADAYVIAVPTPFRDNHAPDLSYIEAAGKSIAPCLAKGNLVILESTAPVGTTEKLAEWLARARPDLSFPQHAGEDADVQLAYCPERVLPGHVLRELVENDRIIGGMTQRAGQIAADLYRLFVEADCLLTTSRTAEMSKLTENAYRDVNIAFANELSVICHEMGINVWELIRLANHHPRVQILQPGPGVGGHCIAVDPWFIVDHAPESARLIRAAREINDRKPHFVLNRIKEVTARFDNPVIACLGLAFKANIGDLRESPALEITRMLSEQHIGKILAVEPNISELKYLDNVELVDLDQALARADVIVILVDHQQFVRHDWGQLDPRNIVDPRGILSRAA